MDIKQIPFPYDVFQVSYPFLRGGIEAQFFGHSVGGIQELFRVKRGSYCQGHFSAKGGMEFVNTSTV
jgi:hypothetical protein